MLKGKVFLYEAAEPKVVLYVLDGCEVAWVSFKAGDALPVDAVAGGYLSTGDGTPCMSSERTWVMDMIICLVTTI